MKLEPSALDLLTSFNDETFVEFLIDSLFAPGDDGTPVLDDLTLLYEPKVLQRLGTIVHDPLMWDAKLAPILRQCRGIWVPEYKGKVLEALASSTQGGADVTTIHGIAPQAITWFWWPYLALGTLAMLDGDPGIGKSLLTLQLAAILSVGGCFPDQQGEATWKSPGPADSLFFAREDSLAQTVRPRLDRMHADTSRIHFVQGYRDVMGKEQNITLADLPLLNSLLTDYAPRLMVLDPIQAYLGAKVDMHRANETRPLLSNLAMLAEKHQCLILCVRHPAKASGQGGGKAMLRGLGSIDFIGAARTGLFVEQHPLDRDKAMVALSKSNIGPGARTHIYSKAGGHFHWAGVTRLDAEILAGNGRGPDPRVFLQAYMWLEQRLEGGVPVFANDLFEQAAQDIDASERTVKRAKAALGVESRRTTDAWEWRLPALDILSPQESSSIEDIRNTLSSTTTLPSSPTWHPLVFTNTYTDTTQECPNDLVVQEDQGCQVGHIAYARVRDTQSVPEPVDNTVSSEIIVCRLCQNRMQTSVTPPRCIACGWRP